MAVTIELGDGSTREIDRARTSVLKTGVDRSLHRAPYSDTAFYGGTGRRNPERVSITFEAHDGTIQNSALLVSDVVADFLVAVLVTTPLGEWSVEGVQAVSKQPSQNGYRVTVTLLASSRVASGTAVYAGSTAHYAGSTTDYAGASA